MEKYSDINILNQGNRRKIDIQKYESKKIEEKIFSTIRFISKIEFVDGIILYQEYDANSSIPILVLEVFLNLNGNEDFEKNKIMDFSYIQKNFIIKSNYITDTFDDAIFLNGKILYDRDGKYINYQNKIKNSNIDYNDLFKKKYTFEFEPPLDIEKIKIKTKNIKGE